jgi:branched-chain amino acid transport system permease protein
MDTTVTQDNDATPAVVHVPPPRRKIGGPWTGLAVAAAVLAVGFAVPYVVTDTYTMSLVLDAALLSMLALGIGFLARHLGLISLGHTAFFGGAAYLVAMGTTHWEWGPLQATVVAILGGTLLALVMGFLVVKASGMGFLMLTLALSQALYQLTIQTAARPLTGAFDGLQVIYERDLTFFGLPQADLMNPGLFWSFAWSALVACAVALWLIGRSRFGTLLEGIRENEERMRFSGYDTFLPRLTAFVISGLVASVGGALFALNAAYVSPEQLGFVRAGDALIAALVGGLGTLLGPVLGVALFTWAEANLNEGGNLHMYTGIAVVLVLAFMPGGITGTIGKYWKKIRRRRQPAAERSTATDSAVEKESTS